MLFLITGDDVDVIVVEPEVAYKVLDEAPAPTQNVRLVRLQHLTKQFAHVLVKGSESE